MTLLLLLGGSGDFEKTLTAYYDILREFVLTGSITSISTVRGTNQLSLKTTSISCASAFSGAVEMIVNPSVDVYFGDVKLIGPDFEAEEDLRIISNVTPLWNGRRRIQTSDVRGYFVTFSCMTNDYQDIRDLRNLVGYPENLSVYGIGHGNCYITDFKIKKIAPGLWEYTVAFEQDTTISSS